MAKKVRFPPLPPLGENEMEYEFPRVQSDITTSKSDLRAGRQLKKQNSEMFSLPQQYRREKAKRTVSLDALPVPGNKDNISPPSQTKKNAFITQDAEMEIFSRVGSKSVMSRVGSSLSHSPSSLSHSPSSLSHLSLSPSPSLSHYHHSHSHQRSRSHRSPTSPLSPLSPTPSLSPIMSKKNLNNFNNLSEWEQVPAECLAFLEDLNARPSDLLNKKPLPKKTVSYDEIFRAIQTKEELTKKYNAIQEENANRGNELKEVEEKISDLKIKLSKAEGDWQNSLVAVARTDARKHKLGNIKQMCLEESDQKDRIIKEKIEAEKDLDNLNAEVATLNVIKKAMQMKLFQASEEKNSMIQNRKTLEDTVETEKTSLHSKILELTNNNSKLEDMMERAKVKVEQQDASEKNLEEQLSKAKDQVVSLIEQIGQKEAREAREIRAQRAAREAETRAKHRHPSGEVTLVFTDVQGSTAQWELHPDVMSVALELHNTILRAKLQLTGGYEVRTEGDSFMVAFHTPLSAVWWCVFVQQALLEADWPARLLTSPHSAEEFAEDGTLLFRGIRVRMGAHVGKAQTHVDALTGRMDYFGPMISGMGRGGQILLSGSVWNAVRADMGSTVTANHIGEIKSKTNTNANNKNITVKLPGAENEMEEIFQILPNSLAKRKFPPLKPITTIVPSDSQSKLSLARIYQNRMEEEIQNNEKTNTEARAKLAVLFKEIETSLAEQEFEKRRAEIAKMCLVIKKKIRDVRRWSVETERVLAHSNAELDVLKYKVEKCDEKNAHMEQEIVKLQAEQLIYKDIREDMETEQKTKRATLQKMNALTFALMVKELTLAQSDNAMSAERDLLERQERECGEIVKALEGEQNFNAKLVINHIFERNRLIEQHIQQAKRDELEARALLHDANLEFEKFRIGINSDSDGPDSELLPEVAGEVSNLQPRDLIKRGKATVNKEEINTKKKTLKRQMEQMDEEKSALEAKAKKLEAELMEQGNGTGISSGAKAARRIRVLDFQIKRSTSEKGNLVARAQHINSLIEGARTSTVACVAAAKDAYSELAVRREVLEDQLEAFSQPIQFNENNESDKDKGEGKLHLSLNTASVGMDGIVGARNSLGNSTNNISNLSNRSNKGKATKRSISPVNT